MSKPSRFDYGWVVVAAGALMTCVAFGAMLSLAVFLQPISEAMGWGASLDRPPRLVGKFYTVLGVALVLGMMLDYFGIDAVKMLFWSAVANGILAPPLIVLVVMLTSDSSVMGEQVNPPLLRWLGWITAAVMTFAAIAMFVAS